MSNDIKLSLPLNPAYVSTIRLTSSSISERMKFGIAEVEDIKTAISETATYIISSCDSSICSSFEINFQLEPDKLLVDIIIPTTDIDFPNETENISILLMKGCMDKFEVIKMQDKNLTKVHLMKFIV